MNITDLITAKVVNLPPDHQAEVLRYVLALTGEPPYPEPHNPERTVVILQRTWGAWGNMSREEIDCTLARMRNEWDRDEA
jgi:hypothetical protein